MKIIQIKRTIFCFCFFLFPIVFSWGATLRDQIKKEGLKLTDIIVSVNKIETNYDKPAKWEISKILKPDFKDGEKYLLVFLEGYSKFEGDYIRDTVVFTLYWNQKGKWKEVGKEWIGQYLGSVDFVDLTNDAKPEMIVVSGLGNHGHTLWIFSVKKGSLKELLYIDGYGCAPDIEKIDGQNYPVDNYVDIEGVCEACRTCRRLIYRWNGTVFKHDSDDLYEARED